MIRSEIITMFREENPEITQNVMSDAVCRTLCVVGNLQTALKARLIVDTGSITIVEDQPRYDLTTLTKFYDIDENPGGGVSIVDSSDRETRLKKRSKAELDDLRKAWRTASSGRPNDYFRRGKYIYLGRDPDETIESLNVDFVAIPDTWNDDGIAPFNQLTHLEPFHYSLVLYLKMRAKAKVGKPEDSKSAREEYEEFVNWMKKEIGGGKSSVLYFRPSGQPRR